MVDRRIIKDQQSLKSGRPGGGLNTASKKKVSWRRAQILLSVFVCFMAIGAVFVGWFTYDLPALSGYLTADRKPSVTFLDRQGHKILTIGDYYAKPIEAKLLPDHVKKAFLAIEDRRFYSHWGVDVFGLIRAAWRNYEAGGVVQGGSTLTQQLAKNFLLSKGLYHHNNRSLRRKIQEVLLAFWLERKLSKDQILTLYLNRVYFGSGAYGLNAAAHLYFNRQARDLNTFEAAVLAGLMKAPAKYSPFVDEERSLGRGRQVLLAMVDSKFITAGDLAKLTLPRFADRMHLGSGFGRYFADWLYDQIPIMIGEIREDLVVSTTMDFALQKRCELAMDQMFLSEAPSLGAHEGAVVAMTPGGAVRAMVGGKHYYSSPFNRAYQAFRQSGSTFKIFVHLMALEQGMSPQSRVMDAPFHAGKWAPRNYDRRYRGEISLQDALAHSINTVSARLTQRFGVKRLQEMALRMGLTQAQPKDLTICLGVGNATLLEMTNAFAIIARDGWSVVPYGISQIKTRSGRVLYDNKSFTPERLLNAHTVASIRQMLAAVMDYGTGKGYRLDQRSLGKTGTTQNYKDAWFIGFTPQIVLGVWMGNDDNTSMDHVTGGKLPAKLWNMILNSNANSNHFP